MRKKDEIYFKGYYGFKNIGDDVFCVTADWLCENYWVDKQPVFIGENLPNLSKSARVIKNKNYWVRRLFELLICIRVSKIIYFGGSVFTSGDFSINNIKYYFNKFKVFNTKLGSIGTSIGPFKKEEDYNGIKEYLSKFKFIALRDYSSQTIASKMGLESKSSFIFDLAILINDVFPSLKKKKIKSQNRKLKIAVSLCHHERYTGGDTTLESKREDSILEFLNKIIELEDIEIEEIVFLQFNDNSKTGDLEITNEFNNAFSGRVKTKMVKYTSDTEAFCNELNECDFLVGVRLHSGILAYALEIPFFLIEYHKKCTEFLNTINNNYRFDLNNNDNNIDNFKLINKQGFIPNLKSPNYFKKIMLKELDIIYKKL